MKSLFVISFFLSSFAMLQAQQRQVRIDTLIECYPGRMYHFTEANGALFVAALIGGEKVKIITTYEVRGYRPLMVMDNKTKNGIVLLYLYSGSSVIKSEYNIINSGVSVPVPITPD